jgi:predicted ribosome quality control (RQC) complex YloA/Tae2 family protein
MRLLSSLLICLFLTTQAYAVDICLSEEQAKQVIVELKQKRILEQEVQEYERLIENLKKQNEILKEQNQLLKEQIELYKNQRQLYETALKECEKKQRVGLFEKGKWFVYGAVSGLIFLMFLMK